MEGTVFAPRLVGKCHKCGKKVYNRGPPAGEADDVGDYDFVCYPCQLAMMDAGTWEEWRAGQIHDHGGGKCHHRGGAG